MSAVHLALPRTRCFASQTHASPNPATPRSGPWGSQVRVLFRPPTTRLTALMLALPVHERGAADAHVGHQFGPTIPCRGRKSPAKQATGCPQRPKIELPLKDPGSN
jgi:hypothetical protein